MVPEMASSKYGVLNNLTSKIQSNNINNKKSYLLGQYHSKQGTHYWQRIKLVKI